MRVLQGLSGTGKGTTVAKLQQMLPRCTAWSNGNVFRALTLLAVTRCEQLGVPFGPEALTPPVLADDTVYTALIWPSGSVYQSTVRTHSAAARASVEA